jgi:L-ascorbate metabolism protein UlaG (beta-lactamase superfamily)
MVFKWILNRDRGWWMKIPDEVSSLKPGEFSKAEKYRLTFINHATFLIQTAGLNLLTDPVFSKRVSPFSWAGPARMRPPGVAYQNLPTINLILLSHNHYDHLDITFLKKLANDHDPEFVVPLGVGNYLKQKGIDRVTELDWHQKHQLDSVGITAVPAQHFSGRGILDRDATLWCGFILESTAGKLYFIGDSGYHNQIFKDTGRNYGPFKVALIPIGAFKPRWFMSPVHMSPEEAVTVHREIRTEKSLAIHFGTFPLADDGMEEPAMVLKSALAVQQVNPENFRAINHGESVIF